MQAIDVLRKVILTRRSVKRYQKDFKIPKKDLEEILTLATYAPSSWNLQHWKFLVIDSTDAKEKLFLVANKQKQVLEASVTVVVLGDLEARKEAHEVYENLKINPKGKEIYTLLIQQIENHYKDSQKAREGAILNAALAAMQLILVACAKGYATCPMEGFDLVELREKFCIPKRYLPILLIAIGKSAAPPRDTTRFPLEKKVVYNSF